MFSRLSNTQNRFHTSIHISKNSLPLLQRFQLYLFTERRFEGFLVLRVLAQGKALQFSQLQNIAQSCGELWLQASHGEPAAILRFVVVIERATVEHGAFRLLLLAASQVSGTGHAVECESGV